MDEERYNGWKTQGKWKQTHQKCCNFYTANVFISEQQNKQGKEDPTWQNTKRTPRPSTHNKYTGPRAGVRKSPKYKQSIAVKAAVKARQEKRKIDLNKNKRSHANVNHALGFR